MSVFTGWTLTVFLMILLLAAVVFGIVYVARKGVPQRTVRRTARRRE